MNIAFYLTPKMNVQLLEDRWSVSRGAEMLSQGGFSAVPVVTAENKYVGIVSEGDFLRFYKQNLQNIARDPSLELRTTVSQLMRPGEYPAVLITESVENLIDRITNQNFVPVVDDLGSFIGIVTRKDVIRHLYQRSTAAEGAAANDRKT